MQARQEPQSESWTSSGDAVGHEEENNEHKVHPDRETSLHESSHEHTTFLMRVASCSPEPFISISESWIGIA